MNEYILIFRHEDGQKVASAEQLEIWMKQTHEWLKPMVAQKKLAGGNGLLFDDSKVVWHKGVVSDGPFGGKKETVGGYIVIKADTVDEVVEFAKGCPVLQGEGNSVEIRKIGKDKDF